MLTEIITGPIFQLGRYPEAMFVVTMIHSPQCVGYPANTCLDCHEAQAWMSVEHARGTKLDHWLHDSIHCMHHVVDDGATVAARGAWIFTSARVEANWKSSLR